MLSDARQRCRLTLNRILGRPIDSPLTLETLLGAVKPTAKRGSCSLTLSDALRCSPTLPPNSQSYSGSTDRFASDTGNSSRRGQTDGQTWIMLSYTVRCSPMLANAAA